MLYRALMSEILNCTPVINLRLPKQLYATSFPKECVGVGGWYTLTSLVFSPTCLTWYQIVATEVLHLETNK